MLLYVEQVGKQSNHDLRCSSAAHNPNKLICRRFILLNVSSSTIQWKTQEEVLRRQNHGQDKRNEYHLLGGGVDGQVDQTVGVSPFVICESKNTK